MMVIDYESVTMHIKHLNCHPQNIESRTRCTILICVKLGSNKFHFLNKSQGALPYCKGVHEVIAVLIFRIEVTKLMKSVTCHRNKVGTLQTFACRWILSKLLVIIV